MIRGVLIIVLPALILASCDDHSKTSCDVCVKDNCDWCPTDSTCHSRYNLIASCGVESKIGTGAWIREPLGCKSFNPLIGPWSGEGKNKKGCTNLNAENYEFMATVNNESCVYSNGLKPFKGEQQQCICSDAGSSLLHVASTPYGRYCGVGYSGGVGQQPCDELDKCCQIDDWCQTQYGSKCLCFVQFRECLKSISTNAGFCNHMSNARGMLLSAMEKLSKPCSMSSPVCNEKVNCHGRGTCTYSGKCDCKPPFDGYDCTECRPGFFPPNKCDQICSSEKTCNGRGTCGVLGNCICHGTYYGAHCDWNSLPLMAVLVGIMIVVLAVIFYIFKRGKRPYFDYTPVSNRDPDSIGIHRPRNMSAMEMQERDDRDAESVATDDLDLMNEFALDDIVDALDKTSNPVDQRQG